MQTGKSAPSFEIQILPPELLLQVFSYLDVSSLCKTSAVCKDWHTVIDNTQMLWKCLCDELVERKKYITRDRARGHSWKEVFKMNYEINNVMHTWYSGAFSNVNCYEDLPRKVMCRMDAEAWGEILQRELER